MAGHELGSIHRHQKGFTALAPRRPVYGCEARCECGERFRSNDAPSDGGRRAIKRAHERHVEEASRA